MADNPTEQSAKGARVPIGKRGVNAFKFQYCVSVTLPVGLRLKGFDKKRLGGGEPVSDVEDEMGDGEEAFQPLLPPVKSKS